MVSEIETVKFCFFQGVWIDKFHTVYKYSSDEHKTPFARDVSVIPKVMSPDLQPGDTGFDFLKGQWHFCYQAALLRASGPRLIYGCRQTFA